MNGKGFTLVEMAMVLVIIGLLLGGIFGARSLIRSAQVSDVISIIEDLRSATASFKARYHYLPGDWPYTANEIPSIVAGPGNGDGSIDINESAQVFNQLFNAGLIKSPTVSTWFGGVTVQIVSTALSGVAMSSSNVVNVILFTNLPCSVAMEIETKRDDNSLSTGNNRASVANCVENGVNDPVPLYAVPLQ